MPRLGQIVRPQTIGKKGQDSRVWHACVVCGKRRWTVCDRTGQAKYSKCHACALRITIANNDRGRHFDSAGYVIVSIPRDDPLACMAKRAGSYTLRLRIAEHRLIMARHLGRPLQLDEHVHHLNGDRQDNRLENLRVMGRKEHGAELKAEVIRLRARVAELEALLGQSVTESA